MQMPQSLSIPPHANFTSRGWGEANAQGDSDAHGRLSVFQTLAVPWNHEGLLKTLLPACLLPEI